MASARKPVELDHEGWALLTSILFRIACSAPWAWDLRREIAAGELPYREGRSKAQAKALCSVGAYPPGGEKTLMRTCATCRKPIPPQCVGSGRSLRPSGRIAAVDECYECFLNNLSIFELVMLPSSPGSSTRFSLGDAIDAGLSIRKPRKRQLEDPDAFERVKFLADDGQVRELVQGEDGFFYEVVTPPKDPETGNSRAA